jgi:hypothetical protein
MRKRKRKKKTNLGPSPQTPIDGRGRFALVVEAVRFICKDRLCESLCSNPARVILKKIECFSSLRRYTARVHCSLEMASQTLNVTSLSPFPLFIIISHLQLALMNIIETLLSVFYLYLLYASPTRTSRSSMLHAAAPLIGFSSALATFWKTFLYWMQEAFCNWCSTGHNDPRSFIIYFVVPNGCAERFL